MGVKTSFYEIGMKNKFIMPNLCINPATAKIRL